MQVAKQKTVDIYYAHFPQELPETYWNAYLRYLPKPLIEANRRYRRWQDRHAHLLGKLLLLIGLRKHGLGHELFDQLKYTDHDRPYLEGEIEFNISHSGHYVVCATGMNLRLGVDIEQVKPIDFDDFTNVMSSAQWQTINNAENPERSFYEHWTIKESIIKADGRGVTIPLEDLNWKDGVSVYEGHSWNLQSIFVDDGYAIHLATDLSGVSVSLQEVDFLDDSTLQGIRE